MLSSFCSHLRLFAEALVVEAVCLVVAKVFFAVGHAKVFVALGLEVDAAVAVVVVVLHGTAFTIFEYKLSRYIFQVLGWIFILLAASVNATLETEFTNYLALSMYNASVFVFAIQSGSTVLLAKCSNLVPGTCMDTGPGRSLAGVRTGPRCTTGWGTPPFQRQGFLQRRHFQDCRSP
jgi:hypothetical protein